MELTDPGRKSRFEKERRQGKDGFFQNPWSDNGYIKEEKIMKKIGGSVYSAREDYTYMKLVKDGKEIWAYLQHNRGDNIGSKTRI